MDVAETSAPAPAAPPIVAEPPPAVAVRARRDWRDEPIEQGTWLSRAIWLSMAAVALVVVVLAAFLTPNPAGHGTHTQLGLPPCGFLVITGLPCPGCGLTTCFSYMAHFDPIGAAFANPFGVMLFLVTLAMIPISLVSAWRGWAVIAVLDRLRADKWALMLACCSIGVWIIRIVTIYLTR